MSPKGRFNDTVRVRTSPQGTQSVRAADVLYLDDEARKDMVDEVASILKERVEERAKQKAKKPK